MKHMKGTRDEHGRVVESGREEHVRSKRSEDETCMKRGRSRHEVWWNVDRAWWACGRSEENKRCS
jgi:hypothetical protein